MSLAQAGTAKRSRRAHPAFAPQITLEVRCIPVGAAHFLPLLGLIRQHGYFDRISPVAAAPTCAAQPLVAPLLPTPPLSVPLHSVPPVSAPLLSARNAS